MRPPPFNDLAAFREPDRPQRSIKVADLMRRCETFWRWDRVRVSTAIGPIASQQLHCPTVGRYSGPSEISLRAANPHRGRVSRSPDREHHQHSTSTPTTRPAARSPSTIPAAAASAKKLRASISAAEAQTCHARPVAASVAYSFNNSADDRRTSAQLPSAAVPGARCLPAVRQPSSAYLRVHRRCATSATTLGHSR